VIVTATTDVPDAPAHRFEDALNVVVEASCHGPMYV